MAQIKVLDNGVGIKPDGMENLFDLFVQGEMSTDRKNGGLGLGLALVKSLVDLHGENVTASSEGEGLGSIFCLELPLRVEPLQ
jgi:signal transduction histidine kinase